MWLVNEQGIRVMLSEFSPIPGTANLDDRVPELASILRDLPARASERWALTCEARSQRRRQVAAAERTIVDPNKGESFNDPGREEPGRDLTDLENVLHGNALCE